MQPFQLRAVFKWLLKVITWLRLLRLVIRLQISRQFFSQLDAKPKPIAPFTHDFFPRFAQVTSYCLEFWLVHRAVCSCVIGPSNYYGFGFSIVIWKPLQSKRRKSRTNHTLKTRFCSRFQQVTGNNFYEFWLVNRAVCSCCAWSC